MQCVPDACALWCMQTWTHTRSYATWPTISTAATSCDWAWTEEWEAGKAAVLCKQCCASCCTWLACSTYMGMLLLCSQSPAHGDFYQLCPYHATNLCFLNILAACKHPEDQAVFHYSASHPPPPNAAGAWKTGDVGSLQKASSQHGSAKKEILSLQTAPSNSLNVMFFSVCAVCLPYFCQLAGPYSRYISNGNQLSTKTRAAHMQYRAYQNPSPWAGLAKIVAWLVIRTCSMNCQSCPLPLSL